MAYIKVVQVLCTSMCRTFHICFKCIKNFKILENLSYFKSRREKLMGKARKGKRKKQVLIICPKI